LSFPHNDRENRLTHSTRSVGVDCDSKMLVLSPGIILARGGFGSGGVQAFEWESEL